MQIALARSSSNNSSRNGGGTGGGRPSLGATGAHGCMMGSALRQPSPSMQSRDAEQPGSFLEASDESHPHPQTLLHQWLASADPSTQRHAAGILAAVNLACSIATWLQPPAAAPGLPAEQTTAAPLPPAPPLPALDSTTLHDMHGAALGQALPGGQNPNGCGVAPHRQACATQGQQQRQQLAPGRERTGVPGAGAAPDFAR